MKSLAVTKAEFIELYKLKVSFNDNTSQIVDFAESLPELTSPKTSDYKKYLEEKHFRSFKIEEGNLVWGKDWDIIYPVRQLHSGKLKILTYSYTFQERAEVGMAKLSKQRPITLEIAKAQAKRIKERD